MIVDFHTHLDGYVKWAVQEGEQSTQYEQLELLLKVMKEAGVDKSVSFLAGLNNFSLEGFYKKILGQLPEEIIPFAYIMDTEDAPQLLEWAVKELRVRGIKIHHSRVDPQSKNMPKVYAKAEELNIPIIFDCFGARTPTICKIGEDYSFPVVLGHMGGLWNSDYIKLAISCAEKNKNVYLETSSVLLFKMLEEAVARVGAERILFGTDGPLVHPKPEIEKIRILHIPEEDKKVILGDNALRLLKVDANK